MLKRNNVAHGLSGWIMALLNGLVRSLLQPARGSVMLASVADLSRSKTDLIAENALLRQMQSSSTMSAVYGASVWITC